MRTDALFGSRGRGGAALLAAMVIFPLVLSSACGRKMMAVKDDPAVHEDRGDQLYATGDLDGALGEYTKALEIGSRKLKVYNNLGNVHYRRGQFALAEKYYREATKIDPLYLFSLNNLALALYQQGNYPGARSVIQEALRGSPRSAVLFNSLALIALRENKTQEAIEDLQKAVEINPDYAVALNNLGDLYLNNPDLGQDPLPLILRAIEKDPENKLFYGTLGWYYCQQGVFDEALIALGKAFVQDPNNIEVRMHYATVLEWLGKEKEALEQWQAVVDLATDPQLAAEARRHYWELKGR